MGALRLTTAAAYSAAASLGTAAASESSRTKDGPDGRRHLIRYNLTHTDSSQNTHESFIRNHSPFPHISN